MKRLSNSSKWLFSCLLFMFVLTIFSEVNSTIKEPYLTDPGPGKQTQYRGGLQFTAALENNYFTNAHRTGYYYAELTGESDEPVMGNRLPLNLSLVIDRSGSMAGEKIQYAKEAAKYLVDVLQPGDYLSLVIYDGSVDVIHAASLVRNKQAIKQKIESIYERGGTNLMGGALAGYNEVKRNYQPGFINRVLLLSDGLANQGITNPISIEHQVKNKLNQEGITISTFGVGRDYNENLMTMMAEQGGGSYYFIDRPHDIVGIISQELNGISQVIAQRITMTLQIPPQVVLEQVYGQPYTMNGNILTVKYSNMLFGETKGVLIRYRVKPNYNINLHFPSTITYTSTRHEQRMSLQVNNNSSFTSNHGLYAGNFNNWVTEKIAMYEANANMEQAMREADKGNYEEARKVIKKTREYIDQQPQAVRESPALKSTIDLNQNYESLLEDAENLSSDEVKFIQKEVKSSNYQIRNRKK